LKSLNMAGTTVGASSEIIPFLTSAPIGDLEVSFPKLAASHMIAQFYTTL
jgi:hypothetical protein